MAVSSRTDIEQRTTQSDVRGRAVIYRIDARSFRDSDGDGVGDLNGIRQRMGYLELLGVDLVWLTAFLATPAGEAGHGCDVDPVLGDLDSFDQLIAEANEAGIGVTIDISVDKRSLDRPGVEREIARAVRFWLDRGVAGFRAGITPGLMEPAGAHLAKVIEVIRPVLDEYRGRAVSAYVDAGLRSFPGLQRLTIATDARFSRIKFDAEDVQRTVDSVMRNFEELEITPITFLAGWDIPRPVARFGGGRRGLACARAMTLVQLAMPGMAGIDNGDELGLSEYLQADEHGGAFTRGFMPWENSNATFGFTDAAHTTPPAPEKWANRTVKAQLEDAGSMLSFFRYALALRREHGSPAGTRLHWYGSPPGCLAFRCGRTGLICALNTTSEPVDLPPGELLLSSDPNTTDALLGNSAAWLI